MNKQEIIKVITDERSAHENWAAQDKIIAEAINFDSLIDPINYEETDLYNWIKSNKSSISAFSWYKELEQVHVKVHYSYSDLFANAMRKYNPKTREQLLEEFQDVKNDIEEFTKKIDQIESEITEMSDIVYLDFVLKSNAVTRKNEEEQNITKTNEESTDVNIVEDNNDNNIKNNNVIDIDVNKSETTELETTELETTKLDTNIDSIEAKVETESNKVKPLIVTKVAELSDVVESVPEAEFKVIPESAIEEVKMKEIDISDYKENSNETSNSNEASNTDTDQIVSITDENENENKTSFDSSAQINTTKASAKLLSDYESIKNGFNSKGNLEKHIALKEQNLKRLKSEKELTEQELKHLEETQKLSQLGVEQLEQRFSLKKEELELEQLDNEKLLETNTLERDQKAELLEEIEQQKITLKNEIIDLEQENIKDELIQEEFKKTPSIEKQFEVLKKSKTKEVDKLQTQLSDKNAELIELKQLVLALADEVADIEDDIEMKQQSIVDLENKEQSKNEERSLKLKENEKVIQQRNTSINSNNEKLDELTQNASNTQNELNELIINFEKMKKTIFSMADVNEAEIAEIEIQQLQKQQQLTEIYNQKTSKQHETEEIQNRIDEAEKTLSQLKSEFEENNKKEEKAVETVT